MLGMAVSGQENYYAQSFPAFGVERRGAPVLAFTKIDSRPILDRSQVYEPDAVVVLDPRLLQSVDVTAGLKPGGQLVINCEKLPPGLLPGRFVYLTVNATALALEFLGRPIVNTAMAGALCAALSFAPLEAIKQAIAETLTTKLVEPNIKIAEAAYREAKTRKGGLIA
jgi:2-oxoacid:acceptor oxidoreductase gamma subunit (pyruvate/2-ketoisovalerate family)